MGEQVRVWVRATSRIDPIGLKMPRNDCVCDIIRETVKFEHLTADLSRLKLFHHNDVEEFIDEETMIGDIANLSNISKRAPFLLKEVKCASLDNIIYAAPSSIGKDWDHFEHEYFFNFASGNLHAFVYFEPFVKFFEDTTGTQHQPTQEYIELSQKLMLAMSKNFESEQHRRQALKTALAFPGFGEFDSYFTNFKSKRAITSDLSYVVQGKLPNRGAVIANVELKNDFGKGGCNPNYESSGYYLHFSADFLEQVNKSYLSPMLLITIIGNGYMQAFGAFRNDKNEPCIDPISNPVSLIYHKHDALGTVKTVACFLQSATYLLSSLRLYYEEAYKEQFLHRLEWFPYFRIQNSLLYTQQICRGTFQGLLNGTDVIIKFVSQDRYGLAVHEHLASQHLAPRILCQQSLRVGWKVIVMELIWSNGDILSSLNADQRHGQASKILAALKEKNYVHGDLRLPNLILGKGKKEVIVLDFDWAGEEGIVHYPLNINLRDIEWPNGVKGGQKIVHENDREMLFNSLNIRY